MLDCPAGIGFRERHFGRTPEALSENIAPERRTSRRAENLEDSKTKKNCSQGFTATTSSRQGPEVGSREQNGVLKRDGIVNGICNRSAEDSVLTSCNMP